MKKGLLFSVLAGGAIIIGTASCNKVPNANLQNEMDSVSYSIGVMNGQQMKSNFQMMAMSGRDSMDIDKFLDGMIAAIKKDSTANSYDQGYSMGVNIRQSIASMKERGEDISIDNFLAAFTKALKGDTILAISPEKAQMVLQTWEMNMQQKQREAEEKRIADSPEAKKNKEDGEKFLAQKEKEAGIQKTASGLLYKVEKEGTGEKAQMGQQVKVHYKGTKIDGTEFDSSYKRNEPTTFTVGQMVPGFNEGLQLMNKGAKYTFYIPAELGYGVQGPGNIGANAVLVFDVELIDVENNK